MDAGPSWARALRAPGGVCFGIPPRRSLSLKQFQKLRLIEHRDAQLLGLAEF